MNLIPLPYRILAGVAVLVACSIVGYGLGAHVRGLSDDKALAALKASQSKALLTATETARLAQAQADAATLAQQQAAITEANVAAQRRADDLATAHGKLTQLQSALDAQAAQTPTVKQWLAAPIPHGVTEHACLYLANDRPSTGC